METKGNKILKNVKMQWMSMLDPLKKIMLEYKPLLVIMQAYQTFIQMANVSANKPFQCLFYQFSIFYCYHAIKFCKLYSNFDNGGKL
jgi:hypothetical protein